MTNAKAAKHRVVMISGDEEILRRRALEEVLLGAEIAKDDFELESFDADVVSPQDWVASVSTTPFIAPRRTGIVRHLLRRDADEAKSINLKALPETALLILIADDETGSEEKVQRMKTTVRKNWEKLVEAAGGVVLRFDADPKKAQELLKKEAAARGKSITDRASQMMAEMTGGSLSRGLDELEKLILFVGETEQIRESDVKTVVVPSREWNVFSMVDAIVRGEVAEALRQLRTLIGSASKAEDAAFRSILPNVSRTLRLLWQARICIEERCSPADAPESVRRLFMDKPNFGKESSYRQNQTMAAARNVSFKSLAKAFAIVSDTDSRLKGALDGFSGVDTLERMVLELAETLSPQLASTRSRR